MLLPTIVLRISLDVFSIHLTHFVHAFIGESEVQIILETEESGEHLLQFELFLDESGTRKDHNDLTLFGQISAFPRTEDLLEMQSACLHYNQDEAGVKFFNFLFGEIVTRWDGFPFRDYPPNNWVVDGLFQPPTIRYDFVELLISDLISEHGFDTQRYKSPKDLPKSFRDPDKETQRKKLLNQLRRELPPINKKETSRGGRPLLDQVEKIQRLAKAQEAEEIKEKHSEITYREIIDQIGWVWGGNIKSKEKLLQYARDELEDADDETLRQIKEYRREEKKKT